MEDTKLKNLSSISCVNLFTYKKNDLLTILCLCSVKFDDFNQGSYQYATCPAISSGPQLTAAELTANELTATNPNPNVGRQFIRSQLTSIPSNIGHVPQLLEYSEVRALRFSRDGASV